MHVIKYHKLIKCWVNIHCQLVFFNIQNESFMIINFVQKKTDLNTMQKKQEVTAGSDNGGTVKKCGVAVT